MKKILLYLAVLFVATGVFAQNIVEYEYWFGNDYANKIVQQIAPAQNAKISTTVDLKATKNGFAIVNFRFKDSNGKYSSVHSEFVYVSKENQGNPSQEKFTNLEYWVDGDSASKKSVEIDKTNGAFTNYLDIGHLSDGMHHISFRLKTNSGNYTALENRLIYKGGRSTVEDTLHQYTELEYWLDTNITNKNTATLEKGNGAFTKFLDIGNLNNGMHLIRYRLKTNSGNYSATQSALVFKAGNASIDDTLHKIVAYNFWFGDDESAGVKVPVDPIEHYVLDIAHSLHGRPDDQLHSLHYRFQEANGVWSSILTKKFTPEADFDIYSTINTFTFQNTTAFGRTYTWNFGDGTPEVNNVSPTHTYKLPGVYFVTLTAENKLGKNSITKRISFEGVRNIAAREASNKGDFTMNIFGAGFTNNSKVYLQDAKGEKIEAFDTHLADYDYLQAFFHLKDKTPGTYDVIVEINGKLINSSGAFKIIEGEGKTDPYAYISGRDRMLVNRWQTFNLHFGNRGDVDAVGVPLVLVTSEPTDFEIEFLELDLTQNPEVRNNQHYEKYKDTKPYVEIDNFGGEEFKGRAYAFYVPSIPAKHENSMKFRVKSKSNVEMKVWTNPPFYEPTFDEKVSTCISLAVAETFTNELIGDALDVIPFASCIFGIYSQITSFRYYGALEDPPEESWENRELTWQEKKFNWGNQVLDWSLILFDCASEFIPGLSVADKAMDIISVVNDLTGLVLDIHECKEKYKKLNQNEKNVRAVSSFDPNEMQGPQGYGDEHYTNRTLPYNYTIFFENLKSATATAQEVIVRDTLDKTKFDFNTFSFSSVKYGDKVLTPPPGQLEFTIDTKHKTKDDIVVRINGKFDKKTGEVFWQFISLDKATMDLSEDPDSGFLPPNVNSPEGEGSVQFSIALLDGVQNGDRIENKANIYFDLNDPILTNTYSNTIDETIPSSRLTGIYTTDKPNTYYVKLTSNDAHSGVRSVTVFQKKNSETYIPILETQADGFFVEVEPGNEYYYYGLALDKVGNVEAEKSDYEVSTAKVSVNETVQMDADVVLSPNVASDLTNLSIRLKNPAKVEYNIYSLDGQHKLYKKLGDSFTSYNEQIDLSGLSQGKYLIVFRIGTQNYIKTINVVR